jgi:hypothetical protein
MDGKVTDFATFAMQCARAFGALILMRHDPLSALVPQRFEVEPWYAERVTDAQRRLTELEGMTAAARGVAYQAARDDHDAAQERYAATARQENARLDAMVAHVTAWTPPSPAHVDLRAFMLDQLAISRNTYGLTATAFPHFTADVWWTAALNAARDRLSRSRESHDAEVARTNERNRWLAMLRASLGLPR